MDRFLSLNIVSPVYCEVSDLARKQATKTNRSNSFLLGCLTSLGVFLYACSRVRKLR